MFCVRTLARASVKSKVKSKVIVTRNVSFGGGAKDLFKKIGDENTQESQKTMKVIRKTGALSIIVVMCSIMWASALESPQIEEKIENIDLSQDIRNLADSSK